MEEVYANQIKGIINFPCCPREKVIVYKGTFGMTSNKCPRCGRYVMFDFEQLKAWKVGAVKGAMQTRAF